MVILGRSWVFYIGENRQYYENDYVIQERMVMTVKLRETRESLGVRII